ncbi:hypothetical protein HAX54_027090, partial [Datura stramonium]|nr:hypothetical protein [Datura stramonium]
HNTKGGDLVAVGIKEENTWFLLAGMIRILKLVWVGYLYGPDCGVMLWFGE